MRLLDWLGSTRRNEELEWTRAAQARMDQMVPDGAVIFAGDSNTFCLVTAAVTPLGVNYGIGRQTAEQLSASMDNYKSMGRARAVSIMVGTNDIIIGKPWALGAYYLAILRKIPAHVPVLLSTIPPLQRPDWAVYAKEAARIARESCDSRTVLVDLYAALEGVPDALTADGIHLDVAGYRIWAELLRAALPAA